MDTQLHGGELLVMQDPANDSTRATALVIHQAQNGGFRYLNSSNATPTVAECPADVQAPIKVERANGVKNTDCSSSTAAKNNGPYDPEGGAKKRRRGGWVTTPFIFGAEAAERLAVTGSHTNLISYLVNEMHQKTLSSATILNTFSSTSGWAPLLGAFVADSYLGRYATILYGSFIYLAGLILITMSAILPSLQPPKCASEDDDYGEDMSGCIRATNLQLGVVYLALSLMVVGSGGIRPCVGPFGASQFDQSDPKENAQIKSYFNWYYFSVMVATLVASTVIVYIQDNVSWGWGFGISAAVMVLSIFSFVCGSFLYRFSYPQGSAFTRMAQVIVAAARKRRLALPADSNLLYYGHFEDDSDFDSSSCCNSSEHSKEMKAPPDFKNSEVMHSRKCTRKDSGILAAVLSGEENEHSMIRSSKDKERPSFLTSSRQFRFLDKAAIETESDWETKKNLLGEPVTAKLNPWRLCPVRQIEELKSILRLMPMWATGVVTGILLAQTPTYLVQQARTMDRHMGGFKIPPASMHVISTITIVVWLPVFDRILVPKFIAPRTGNPRGLTYLQKIGLGYTLHMIATAIAVVVEHERRAAARHYGLVDKPHEVIPFSVWTLVPQLVLDGLGSCFGLIGHYEFYYHMVPEHLTSTASALSQTSTALGTLLASALLNLVQSLTNHGPNHPGWLDENLNKAHLDYYYIIMFCLMFVNVAIYYLVVAKRYKRQLMGC
ncbi:hypothetical protein Mapa_007916 [Marchantia paleacea]|nr:hypothetical protein Mapa_007916 [Marchantia paleacea]